MFSELEEVRNFHGELFDGTCSECPDEVDGYAPEVAAGQATAAITPQALGTAGSHPPGTWTCLCRLCCDPIDRFDKQRSTNR
ncbi:hypothetical protein H9Y04_43995 [Streptomyces sp. TRM66268-LWL]|uniref:Uncharacterized protein n=1 Tax=Streptomyces polyasparticus TaxID=2767826 RepID=A0ABR7SVH2_9ACTN|nr:hypothetical protein [Streptomyces polyasparticus]MBC9719490.1 hypothetical protein [Streptomyces polyasparticus]